MPASVCVAAVTVAVLLLAAASQGLADYGGTTDTHAFTAGYSSRYQEASTRSTNDEGGWGARPDHGSQVPTCTIDRERWCRPTEEEFSVSPSGTRGKTKA